jgi:Ala-tRNA(Pro) deacylase
MSAITELLTARGVSFEVLPHAEAYTSIEEARALGIDADEVIKTVVIDTAGGHALAVVPASRRLDMNLVRAAIGDSHAALATEREIERDFSDFELGALPPLGSLLSAALYVDPEVLSHEAIVFAAGRQTESVKTSTRELFDQEPHTTAPLTVNPEDELKDWG